MSMAEIPVEIISSGYTYAAVSTVRSTRGVGTYTIVWVDGTSIDIEVIFCEHLWSFINSSS